MVGKTLSHYRIVEKIGAGGMGEVYRARDEHLGRDVAIKVLPAGTLSDEHARKRFRKEAQALSKLNHPHIATIFDFDTQDGTDFLVMELVEGVTLSDKLAAGALPEKEITRLGMQLAEALEEAHEQGVVHRDFKPGNVMVTPKGQAKILDFGLAKLLRPVSETATTESFTETQGVAGTLPYMAPEQLRGLAPDHRSDIYSFGVVLYEMATGQRPFQERLATALAHDIITKPPPPPGRLKPDLSSRLEETILKALEKEPENRYQSAKELLVDLRRLKRDTDSGRAAVAGAASVTAPTKKRWKVLAPVAALVVVLAGAASFFYFQRAQALTESDYILLADFNNSTGEPVFDATLKQALAVNLEESPYLNIFPGERVRATLRMMEREPDERITESIGREICERQGIKAMLWGEIAPLGSHYVISLNAVNCQTDDSLAREQEEATSKEEVLEALGRASSRLRRKLGESLSSIEKFNTPLVKATTPSLEALKAYTLGAKSFRKGRGAEAISFFKRATELDPNFVMAYADLGLQYWNLGEREAGIRYRKKAFDLRGRASERTRLGITAVHYSIVTGERAKARESYELLNQTYPRNAGARTNLGVEYMFIGQYEKAIEEIRESVRLSPKSANRQDNLAIAYRCLNQIAEAKAILEREVVRNPNASYLHTHLYKIAFIEGDRAEMQRQADWARGKPGEFKMLDLRAAAAASSGKMQEARKLWRQALELARRLNRVENAASVAAHEALTEAELGHLRSARERAEGALAGTPGKDVLVFSALALARSGAAKRAQALANDLAERFPTHTLLNARAIPTIQAILEIQRGNPARALELLEATTPYELGYEGIGWAFSAIYTRGRAYLLMGRGEEAAVEFQKILNQGGIDPTSILHALAHLRSAQAKALMGDQAAARRHYEDFLALWQDADPDIPILQEAKAEYAKLLETGENVPTN